MMFADILDIEQAFAGYKCIRFYKITILGFGKGPKEA